MMQCFWSILSICLSVGAGRWRSLSLHSVFQETREMEREEGVVKEGS